MANLSASEQVLNILKKYYVDKVDDVLLRESPILGILDRMRVEGKEFAFAVPYGASGAVSAKFLRAKNVATNGETVGNAEFTVTPGKIFSPYTMSADEVQASLTKKGAYLKVAGEKLYMSTRGLRRTMAVAFYGDGYGVIGNTGSVASIAASGTQFTFTDSSIPAAVEVGQVLRVKSTASTADAADLSDAVQVIAADDFHLTLKPVLAQAIASTSSKVIALDGSVNSDGSPRLPVGLAGWLPTDRTNISTTFYGVNRSINPDRLAGIVVDDSALAAASNTKIKTLQKAFMRARNHGLSNDNCLIVVNPFDFQDISDELELRNRFVTPTTGTGKKSATAGINKLAAAASTNFADRIYDDPHMPKGKFYILDMDVIKIWSFTNTGFIDNGIAENNPGKESVEANSGSDGYATDPSKLIIDDYINVQPAEGTDDGPSVLVTLFFTGTFVVKAPGNNAVGLFPAA